MRNEKLTAARKKSGKTQAQVAKEIGIAEVAYQRYEYRKREPNVTTAIKVANALGIESFQDFCELWAPIPQNQSV